MTSISEASTTKKGWSKNIVEWQENGTANISVVFSWDLQKAYQRAVWQRQMGYVVKIGGPAAYYQPRIFDSVAEVCNGLEVVQRHNPEAVFTSTGCIRDCEFCIVHKTEGDLKEKKHWIPRRIVCDNNLLACSRVHFDKVIDSLKPLKGVDFNQGLDARLLTDYHAQRIAELDLANVRLAWDHVEMESKFMQAFERLRKAGIPKNKIFVYVLIGYKDTPNDALYRLETVKNLGALPSPMRFQELAAKKRNSYVGENWTNRQLIRYMRYWANLTKVRGLPFEQSK